MKEQEELDKFFNSTWKAKPLEKWEHTGIKLIDKIKPNESVIDVGCGDNLFKGKIDNLIGIDPYNTLADIKVGILEFETDKKFDVAFCLGSIKYGNEETIIKQISKIVSILKNTNRIYWRFNASSSTEKTPIFIWNEEKIKHFANMFNYQIKYMAKENEKFNNKTRGLQRKRIYCEWIKNNE